MKTVGRKEEKAAKETKKEQPWGKRENQGNVQSWIKSRKHV